MGERDGNSAVDLYRSSCFSSPSKRHTPTQTFKSRLMGSVKGTLSLARCFSRRDLNKVSCHFNGPLTPILICNWHVYKDVSFIVAFDRCSPTVERRSNKSRGGVN